jgi:hypothetical protein
MSTTFEGAVRKRVGAYQQEIQDLEARILHDQHNVHVLRAELDAVREAHNAYVLQTVPYVREYFMPPPSAVAPRAETASWFKEQGHVQRKGAVFRRYMFEVEHHPGFNDMQVQPMLYDVCTDCPEAPALVMDCEYQVCPQCGRCFPITTVTYKNLSFEQQVSDIVPIASYRRSNHFAEWLSKLQAREMTRIPEDVTMAVRVELKKQRLSECADISQAKIREILKKLKFSKYYEHVPSIHSIITKTTAPRFPQSLEDKLKQLFDEIQVPFEKHKGTKRSNMLSYGFLLYKFCELLGEDEYLPYLPLLKSTAKLYECDLVWKKICADRQWEFVPTV